MKNQKINNVLLVLGVVWIIVGLIIYKDSNIWPIGFLFLLIWLIGKFDQKKESSSKL